MRDRKVLFRHHYWRLRERCSEKLWKAGLSICNSSKRAVHITRALVAAFGHYVLIRLKKIFLGRPVVAISLTEHMGDIVAASPVAAYIRHLDPRAYVVWCVRAQYREVVDTNPCVDETLTVTCLTEWIFLRKSGVFDKVVDLHIQERVCPVCEVPLKKEEGDLRITLENYYFFGNLLAVVCQNGALPILKGVPCITIPDAVASKIDALNLPSHYVTLHCSSNEVSRDWIPAHWETLIEKIISELDLTVVEVGLSAVAHIPNNARYISLCGKLSILETAEVIRRSILFVGIDSGPAHLANAVGTYGIILLGHYRAFKRYMPYSGSFESGASADIIYEDGPVANVSPGRVFSAIKRRLEVSKTQRVKWLV